MRASRIAPVALLILGVLAAALGPGSIAAADDPTPGREAAAPTLNLEGAVLVEGLVIETGMATIHLERGTLFPASTVNGRVVELAFLGEGRLTAAPPDEIEAAQLELFLGTRSLNTAFQEAVFVVTRDRAVSVLLGERAPHSPDAATTARAVELFEGWRDGAERRQFRVQSALLRDAAGDPLMERYFAAWFRDDEVGDYLYLVDPEELEQVTLGQWVPLDATKREERKIRRAIHSEQQKGRMVGLELDDLGTWETWMSATLRTDAGLPEPGRPSFQVSHYDIDFSIATVTREASARARLRLSAVVDPGIAVTLTLSSDFRVSTVTDGDGRNLPFHREGNELLVMLANPLASGEEIVLEISYSGNPLEKQAGKLFALRDTLGWYPGIGSLARATFDVTLHFPKKFDLLSSGQVVDSGTEGNGMEWIRSVLDVPSPNFSFEMGDLDIVEEQAGHVSITLGFDRQSKGLAPSIRRQVQDTIRESVLYYEEIFGPYPLDHLTVVTVPREYSQGFFGFITLSDLMLTDSGFLRFWLQLDDRRTVIAHEVAHQWWGNIMGWTSYRDQWLSEATASYASLLYVRNRLEEGARPLRGPISGWERELLGTTTDGRTMESLGPLVLGARLNSARYGEAYQPIVYTKGAMVLDTLARFFREDQFVEMLRHLLASAANRDISTEEFLAAIEKMSGVDLAWFRERYVYGTGIPEVDYTYEFKEGVEGGWYVQGTAARRPIYRYQYRAVQRPSEGHDVIREPLAQGEVEGQNLVVPFQILVDRAEENRPESLAVVHGRMMIPGESSAFHVNVDHRPLQFWIDRRSEALATFHCESREPKRVIFYQALGLAAAKRFEAAETAFRRALEVPVRRDADPENLPSEEILAVEAADLDHRIRFQIVRLYLDQDRDDEAREVFDSALEGLDRDEERHFGPMLRYLESRMEIRQGRYDEAYRRLRRPVLARRTDRSTEAYVLLAIAAAETGHDRDAGRARGLAEARGADLLALASPSTPEGS